MPMYLIVGLLALLSGFLNLKAGNTVGTSGINILQVLAAFGFIGCLILIIYIFFTVDWVNGLFSILAFLIGGGLGAKLGSR